MDADVSGRRETQPRGRQMVQTRDLLRKVVGT